MAEHPLYASLGSLPQPLLEQVLSHALDTSYKHTLASLCRVSRSLHRACIPLLYESIKIGVIEVIDTHTSVSLPDAPAPPRAAVVLFLNWSVSKPSAALLATLARTNYGQHVEQIRWEHVEGRKKDESGQRVSVEQVKVALRQVKPMRIFLDPEPREFESYPYEGRLFWTDFRQYIDAIDVSRLWEFVTTMFDGAMLKWLRNAPNLKRLGLVEAKVLLNDGTRMVITRSKPLWSLSVLAFGMDTKKRLAPVDPRAVSIILNSTDRSALQQLCLTPTKELLKLIGTNMRLDVLMIGMSTPVINVLGGEEAFWTHFMPLLRKMNDPGYIAVALDWTELGKDETDFDKLVTGVLNQLKTACETLPNAIHLRFAPLPPWIKDKGKGKAKAPEP